MSLPEEVVPRIPTPFEAYEGGLYHYPVIEPLPPPLCIPVLGPAPFNRFAAVQTRVAISEYRWTDDVLHRRTLEMPTALTIKGVDPLAPARHPVEHSSTGIVRMMQASDDTSFVIALDGIHPESRFDANGQSWIAVDVAHQFDQVFAAADATAVVCLTWSASVHPRWVSLAGASASTMSCGQAHTVGRRERSADGVSARTACRGRAKSRSRAGLDFHELGGPCIQRLSHPAPGADRLSLRDAVLRPCLQPGYRWTGRLGMDLCGPRLYLRHRALGRRRGHWSAALCERVAPRAELR
jgi:hypothetical protein